MNNLAEIADRTISLPFHSRKNKTTNGKTRNIINVILNTVPLGLSNTRRLAPYFQAQSVYHTCLRLWHFLKSNIKYQIDPLGKQFIQTPSVTWWRKRGDCKSYSVFISTILKNLNIEHRLKFVSFEPDGEYTHVYIIVPYNGRQIIMDVVMPEFNKEKHFSKQKLYNMAEIYQMSGIGQVPNFGKPVFSLGNRRIESLTEGELDLLIARDRLLTEKRIVESIRGIGSLKSEKYQDSIDMVDDALEAIDEHKQGKLPDIESELEVIADYAVNGSYSLAPRLHGIGDIGGSKRRAARKKRKAERKAIRKSYSGKEKRQKMRAWRSSSGSRTGKFLQKIGQGVAKGAKALAKVVTAPARLVAKGILEVALPKSAPYFLYLFITDKETISKLPGAVKSKRKKQEQVANFIVRSIGMKRRHFMGIVRNGIMKKYGKSPEKVIQDELGEGVAGIGSIPAGALSDINRLLHTISRAYNTKPLTLRIMDMPASSDFGAKRTRPLRRPGQAQRRKPTREKDTTVLSRIPRAAPYFLYLFIKDEDIVKSLPANVRAKRKKQEEVAEYIVTATGISRNQFMGILRKGIKAIYKKAPEAVITMMTQDQIDGIGAFGSAAITALIGIIKKIAGWIKGRKGKKIDVSENDAPAVGDWAALINMGKDAVKSFNNDIESQPHGDSIDFDDDFSTGGSSFWDTLKF